MRVFNAIKETINGLELRDLEDFDGSETYHPDMRRLSDILQQKTHFTVSPDNS